MGFHVCQLSDRRFRFSVASNKVGHFVYGLKDRIWPDFVCHFYLFRGTHPKHFGSLTEKDLSWNSADHNLEVAQRSPTLLRPKHDFLKHSAATDHSSRNELAKFGLGTSHCSENTVFGSFTPITCDHDKVRQNSVQQSSVVFGSFVDPVFLDPMVSNSKFCGANFLDSFYSTVPKITLENIMDLRLSRYSDEEIMEL